MSQKDQQQFPTGSKLVIAGSRNYIDSSEFYDAIFNGIVGGVCKAYNVIEIVSGGAIGPDQMGEEFALANSLPIKQFKPNWDEFGKGAGMMRNKDMAEYGDVLVAFWDGKSKGTEYMINQMKKLNKPILIENFGGPELDDWLN